MKIMLLAGAHDRARFDCGVPELNEYLRKLANQHTKKNISRTFVIVDNNAQTRVLCCRKIRFVENFVP